MITAGPFIAGGRMHRCRAGCPRAIVWLSQSRFLLAAGRHGVCAHLRGRVSGAGRKVSAYMFLQITIDDLLGKVI